MMKPASFIAFFVVLVSVSCTNIMGGSASNPLPKVCTNIDNVDDTNSITLNQDYKRRDQLLGLSVEWGKTDIGGVMWIEKIPMSTVAQLYEEKFLDPSDRQNFAPSAKELMAFMCKYPSSLASGYAVSPDRDDYRVTIDGIQVPFWSINPKVKSELEDLCKDADELDTSGDLYCWWD